MTEASFKPEGYLRFDLSQGLVSTPDKRRHFIVPAEIINAAGTYASLEEAARKWGQEQGAALVTLAGKDVLDRAPEQFIAELAHLMATLGWGWCELESWGGVLFVVVHQGPRGAGNKILSAFLGGVFSAAAGQRFECVGIDDGTARRFLLTGPEHASRIQGWVDAGAACGEVVSRMHAGDHLGAAQATTGGA